MKLGRVFRTKEEAEFFSEQELVRAELWALADDDQEWDGINKHCLIAYDWYKGKLQIEGMSCTQYNIPYFKSGQFAQSAIEKVGEDRIKKYIYRVM
jgi:hypothetical protein